MDFTGERYLPELLNTAIATYWPVRMPTARMYLISPVVKAMAPPCWRT